MKLPREISGRKLARLLKIYGYVRERQTGSHITLNTNRKESHKITIPDHHNLKVGTLNSILNSVAEHFGISKSEVINSLFS
ncbi:type II toxin-antitoxin system HicA family toxin [bacterium]|nr:type II toxin-antitoxin system HicA family toxin [bacterium]